MNKNHCLFLTGVLFLTLVSPVAWAQTAVTDSSAQPVAFQAAVNVYNAQLGSNLPLYSGPEYNLYDPHITGTAYYQDVNTFTKGTVRYDGYLYYNVPMIYDLNLDQLAILLPNGVSKITLLKERVKAFDFIGCHFVHIVADSLAANSGLSSGYYRQLYAGTTELLGKYSKSIQTTTSMTTGLESYFSFSKNYYIKHNNVYVHISGSQGSLLDVLKDKKKELKQFIKSGKIVYKDEPEAAMVKILNYYDHLSK